MKSQIKENEYNRIKIKSNRSVKSITELNPEHHFDVLSDDEATFDSAFENQQPQPKVKDNDIDTILLENRRIDTLRAQAIEANKARMKNQSLLNTMNAISRISRHYTGV